MLRELNATSYFYTLIYIHILIPAASKQVELSKTVRYSEVPSGSTYYKTTFLHNICTENSTFQACFAN